MPDGGEGTLPPLEINSELVEILSPTEARVKAKSNEGWYAIDLAAGTCTCRGFMARKNCRHLQTVQAFAAGDRSPSPSSAAEIFPVTLATSRYQAREKIVASALVPVRITVGRPRWQLGYELGGFVSELAPYGVVFKIDDRAEFAAAYRERLDGYGLERIQRKLCALSAEHDGRGLVLCCYEDLTKPDEWCHRSIFADWWRDNTTEEVREL